MSEDIRKKILFGVLLLAIIYGAYNFWPSGSSNDVVENLPTIARITAQAEINPGEQANLIDIKKGS